MGHDKSRLSKFLYNIGHGKGLAGTCGSKQGLKLITFFKAFYQVCYRLGLIPHGLKF